jgi:hypothetical protein
MPTEDRDVIPDFIFGAINTAIDLNRMYAPGEMWADPDDYVADLIGAELVEVDPHYGQFHLTLRNGQRYLIQVEPAD